MREERENQTIRYYGVTLALRGAAFAVATAYALRDPAGFDRDLAAGPARLSVLAALWLALMASMALRLLPSRWETLGCQKEFAGRFRPTGRTPEREEVRAADRGALWVLLSWAALNALFFLARWRGWVNDRFLVCLAGFYGVCDIVCILFFCPFQAWMMHNRCCTTCRVYNWDYPMICTPLLALRGVFAVSACLLALAVFLRWEATYRRHQERFFESSNEALECARCREQLCRCKRAMARRRRARQGSGMADG